MQDDSAEVLSYSAKSVKLILKGLILLKCFMLICLMKGILVKTESENTVVISVHYASCCSLAGQKLFFKLRFLFCLYLLPYMIIFKNSYLQETLLSIYRVCVTVSTALKVKQWFLLQGH